MPETTKASYDVVVQSLVGFRDGLDRFELILTDLVFKQPETVSAHLERSRDQGTF